jgi:hypothetical protein
MTTLLYGRKPKPYTRYMVLEVKLTSTLDHAPPHQMRIVSWLSFCLRSVQHVARGCPYFDFSEVRSYSRHVHRWHSESSLFCLALESVSVSRRLISVSLVVGSWLCGWIQVLVFSSKRDMMKLRQHTILFGRIRLQHNCSALVGVQSKRTAIRLGRSQLLFERERERGERQRGGGGESPGGRGGRGSGVV